MGRSMRTRNQRDSRMDEQDPVRVLDHQIGKKLRFKVAEAMTKGMAATCFELQAVDTESKKSMSVMVFLGLTEKAANIMWAALDKELNNIDEEAKRN